MSILQEIFSFFAICLNALVRHEKLKELNKEVVNKLHLSNLTLLFTSPMIAFHVTLANSVSSEMIKIGLNFDDNDSFILQSAANVWISSQFIIYKANLQLFIGEIEDLQTAGLQKKICHTIHWDICLMHDLLEGSLIRCSAKTELFQSTWMEEKES